MPISIEPVWVGIGGICLLFILLFSGVYIAIALGISGFIGVLLIIGFKPATTLLATTFFYYSINYAFIVVPLFVVMGLFAAETEICKDSYDAMAKWFGRIKGGLGLATVGGCTIFGTLTGSSIVTSVVFAKISVPEMVRFGYDKKISYGLVSSAGSIGMMIPPSLLVVLYALITEDSVGQLLMGGIGPGLTLAFCLGGCFILLQIIRPHLTPPTTGMSAAWKERFISLTKLWPAIVVATVVIGGIYTGIFTVVEAAGIGAFVLFSLFIVSQKFSRETWPKLAACLRETISLTAMVLFIIVSARLFSRLLVLSDLGRIMTIFIISAKLSSIGFLVAATALYLLLGCFIDGFSILAITVPIFLPVVDSLGIDRIWFAMLMIVATQIGLVTPPVGLSVYAVKGVAGTDISLEDIFRGVLPFFVALLVTQAILISFPIISTWIPYHIMK